MENHQSDQEEALRFARVWKRVMPEGGPIVPAFAVQPVEVVEEEAEASPAGKGESAFARFLKGQISAELQLGREGQHICRRSGCGEFAACTGNAEKRARRLAATLYLLTGEWCLPMRGNVPHQDGRRAGLRSMYRRLQTLELAYLTQAAREQGEEDIRLLKENAASCHRDGVLLRRLVEQWGPL